uniref:BED-type domain-containing protein n=1 Tax=Chenopodium quinoa TaxID=63459 RepID=A0A803N206_CHEQI
MMKKDPDDDDGVMYEDMDEMEEEASSGKEEEQHEEDEWDNIESESEEKSRKSQPSQPNAATPTADTSCLPHSLRRSPGAHRPPHETATARFSISPTTMLNEEFYAELDGILKRDDKDSFVELLDINIAALNEENRGAATAFTIHSRAAIPLGDPYAPFTAIRTQSQVGGGFRMSVALEDNLFSDSSSSSASLHRARSEGSQGTTDSYSCNMESSQSKRSASFSEQTSQPLSEKDMEELQSTLPPDKKLKAGREYIWNRKSKRKAEYWKYYLEYVENGKLRAECKFCPKTFAADGNLNGSKNVKNHAESCLDNPINIEKEKGKEKQTKLYFDQEHESSELKCGSRIINLNDVREALIHMIIVDELPFKHVEKSGFRHFVQVACPQFHIPSRVTIARDCLKLYYSEKEKLREMFKTCQRISVTTDTWTSIQRINYMCLTAHFIDNDWKLNKKIINFCPISSHKGEAIGKAVEACLEYWGIDDKLFTVTVDNASSNDVACAHLSRMVRRTGCINDGKNLHVRCIAHIINLIVWDGIREHGVCIDRVRNAVKYVKNSPARILRFKDLVQKANIDSKSSLSFDVPTRWNSTYIMLETALKFRRVFSGLSLPDGEDLNDNERPPEPEDWEKVERLVLFLGGFYLLTKRISGSHYVTANKGLGEIASMYDMLNNWEQSEDLNFQAMAIAMKKKFDKYWGDVDKMNKFIYVALLLDPHSKMVIVELTLTDMHGPEKGTKLANDVKEFAYSLFEEYRKMYATSNIPDCGDNMSMDIDNSKGVGSDYVRKLKERAKRLKGTSGYAISELDRYLNDQLGPEEEEQDALTWWGKNGQRYVILNRMARDILAIPLSTVASEYAFSTGGRTLDPFRSSLTPKMVQALLCTQDWLRAKEVPIVDVEENLKELEEIEKEVQRGESNDVDDEVVFNDVAPQNLNGMEQGKIELSPDGLWFDDHTVSGNFTKSWKEHYSHPYMNFTQVPLMVRDHWFTKFKDVIDGKLCEKFPTLPMDMQRKIANELHKTPAEILLKLDEIQNKII